MSCDLTEADIEAGLRVKSEQLNADDLIARDIIAKIVRITPGSAEQAWQIWLEGHKVPWRPCKTMRKLMTGAWGKPSQAWIGRRVHLYRDPETKWAGEAVGGIRLRAMSDIPAGGFSMKLNETKKTKATVEVALLRAPQPAQRPQQQATAQPAGVALPEWAATGDDLLTMDQAEEIEALILACGVPLDAVTKAEGASSRWTRATVRTIVGKLPRPRAAQRVATSEPLPAAGTGEE